MQVILALQQGTVMIGKDGNTGASKALYVKGDGMLTPYRWRIKCNKKW